MVFFFGGRINKREKTYFFHRGTRFSHTPYYSNLPPNIHPSVPPSTPSSAPTNFNTTRPHTLTRGMEWTDSDRPKIWESIQAMDHEAMEVLKDAGEEGCVKRFREYLERTEVRLFLGFNFWDEGKMRDHALMDVSLLMDDRIRSADVIRSYYS